MAGHTHTAKRIVIVGGGVSGLSIAASLAQQGLPVTVLEASDLGSGASTRNQGWLASGAWFAPEDPELARMCYRSLQQTLTFCPEAIEPDSGSMTYLVESERNAERWTSAWDNADIPCRELASAELFERFPGIDISGKARGFELPDVAIRMNVLLQQLAESAQRAGAEIRTGASVTRLTYSGNAVQGVEVGHGEVIPARLVLLAGNAKGKFLHPDHYVQGAGSQAEVTLVAQKTHLVALRPQVSRWPLCVVEAGGFNHIPHSQSSVFGSNRWLPIQSVNDERVDPSEVYRIWDGVRRLFPHVQREDYDVVEWAGTTVQAMHVDQIAPGRAPRPTVVDHERECPPVDNLLSVFPGRASLWCALAEMTQRTVLQKLEWSESQIAVPPWAAFEDSVQSTANGWLGR